MDLMKGNGLDTPDGARRSTKHGTQNLVWSAWVAGRQVYRIAECGGQVWQ